ncbi:MAG: helix-turn-helix domain-containing protein [Candidatus Buchananbacteria bacterium]|nr:helix-turn-helix domain-containing protein [Candidatus Buchananbacteria bacterium]
MALKPNNLIFVSNYGILTLEEVAKIMKVSQKTVYRWVNSRKLRAAKFGHKTYRILEKDLVKFINQHMS